MELTQEEKQLLINVLSQVNFKLGESEVAKKYEAIIEKLMPKNPLDREEK